VPRLIVLNGPPAIGKSTLARRYVDAHPWAMDVDIDSVRRLFGRWQDDPVRAGLLARAMTLTMARAHLDDGYDVVLPQYLGNPLFLEQAETVAVETGAQFFEFVLMDNRDEVVRRFNERTRATAKSAHLDAGRLVAQLGGDPALFAMYDRLLLVISARAGSVVVQCPRDAIDEVYAELEKRIGA
jgi:predicted kinase